MAGTITPTEAVRTDGAEEPSTGGGGVLTPMQEARRARIIQAAIRLATAGGFDAVQMRVVAAEANVALGTLYRYFPSKEYLLVSAMIERLRSVDEQLADHPPTADTPADRVVAVLETANRGLLAHPLLAQATIRSVVTTEAALGPAVRQVEGSMSTMVLRAIDPSGAQADESDVRQVAAILYAVWLSGLVGLQNGYGDLEAVEARVRRATELLLPA